MYKVLEAITVKLLELELNAAEEEGFVYLGSLTGQQGSVAILHRKSRGSQEEVAGLLCDAVLTDGAHHKQWYLEQIADKLGVELPPLAMREGGIPA